MSDPLLAFRHPAPPLQIPPGASPLLASILLAIECCECVADLADWWRTHQPALRRLPRADLAEAVARKDARKLALAPPTPKATPPSAHAPTTRAAAPAGQGWLV